MNCHMPETTYGLLKTTRSHTIASPTLAESLEVGRPNACSLCHLDRTLQWTGEKLAEWYRQPAPGAARGGRGLTDDEQRIAAGMLWITRGDAGLRALVACAMARPEVQAAARHDWFAPMLDRLLQDPYHAVRFIAERGLKSLPGRTRAEAPRAGAPAPQLLIDATGRFDEATFTRLLAERDHRRVYLAE